jgi:hypothetical protein
MISSLEAQVNAFREHRKTPEQKEFVKDVQQCSEEYRHLFSPDNIENLQKLDVEDFLNWRGRWSGLYRQKGRIVSDMDRLKEALIKLLDEKRDIKDRLDELIPQGKPNYIKGLGRAVLTAILHLVYPDKYGVYNQTSEDGLKELGRMPKFDWGENFGSRYVKVNRALLQLSQDTGLSLAEVDVFLWDVVNRPVSPVSEGADYLNIIEKHLQQLLADNWEQIDLAKEWGIYEQDGEQIGVELQADDAGRIDILCQKRSGNDGWRNEWLVIELKRDTGGHAAIGQLLSYMGWVLANKAENKGEVEGLLIVRELDRKLEYALKACGARISVKKYNISLSLTDVNLPAG